MYNLEEIIEKNVGSIYEAKLNLEDLNTVYKKECLSKIFNRDIKDNDAFKFREKQINPTKINNNEEDFNRLYLHLTTVTVDEITKKREFDVERSMRLHWIKHHIDEQKKENILIFSTDDSGHIRTYIYDEEQFYVIVLENSRPETEYYLLSAYYCNTESYRRKIKNKYKRRLSKVY